MIVARSAGEHARRALAHGVGLARERRPAPRAELRERETARRGLDGDHVAEPGELAFASASFAACAGVETKTALARESFRM